MSTVSKPLFSRHCLEDTASEDDSEFRAVFGEPGYLHLRNSVPNGPVSACRCSEEGGRDRPRTESAAFVLRLRWVVAPRGGSAGRASLQSNRREQARPGPLSAARHDQRRLFLRAPSRTTTPRPSRQRARTSRPRFRDRRPSRRADRAARGARGPGCARVARQRELATRRPTKCGGSKSGEQAASRTPSRVRAAIDVTPLSRCPLCKGNTEYSRWHRRWSSTRTPRAYEQCSPGSPP